MHQVCCTTIFTCVEILIHHLCMKVCTTPVSKMDPQWSMMTVVSSVFFKGRSRYEKKVFTKRNKKWSRKMLQNTVKRCRRRMNLSHCDILFQKPKLLSAWAKKSTNESETCLVRNESQRKSWFWQMRVTVMITSKGLLITSMTVTKMMTEKVLKSHQNGYWNFTVFL